MSRPLNPRQLEAFRAVMLTGSMTAAARLMSISQPAVTRLIQDLEADLSLKLFDRHGTHSTPTAAATALHKDVARHFLGSARIREAAERIRLGRGGHLSVASILALSLACMPRAAQGFLAAFPEATLSLQSAPSLELLDLVLGGHFDLGLLSVPAQRGDVAHRPLIESEAVCLVPRGHRLAARPELVPADFDGEDLIALAPDSLMRLQLDAALQAAGARPRLRLESRYSATVANAVCEGLGIGVTDPLAILSADPARAVARRFRPRIAYQVSLVFPPTDAPSSLAMGFVAVCEAVIGEAMAASEARLG